MWPPVCFACVVCGSRFVGPQLDRRTCDRPECRLSYERHLQGGGRTCPECGWPHSSDGPKPAGGLCGDPQCLAFAQINSGIPEASRCSICHVPLPPGRAPAGACFARECLAVVDWRERENRARRKQEIHV